MRPGLVEMVILVSAPVGLAVKGANPAKATYTWLSLVFSLRGSWAGLCRDLASGRFL